MRRIRSVWDDATANSDDEEDDDDDDDDDEGEEEKGEVGVVIDCSSLSIAAAPFCLR